MNAENVRNLATEVYDSLTQLESVMRERDFYIRVLKQAVLSHNGELVIDPTLGMDAYNDTRILECNNGGVRLIENPFKN